MTTARRVFRYDDGSIHDRFHRSRAKIQLFGGGFGNGKTANACIKALNIARDYPGSRGLIARATWPKLRDTIMKEMKKWCPKHWIKSWPTSPNSDLTLKLANGSEISFRHVRQEGKQSEDGSTTSNVLSTTYDYIIVDQIEDPEFTYKDFTDLLGRLRGSTPYAWREGDELYDPTMPTSGPRWFIPLCNPTRNWVYKKLVKPYHDYLAGRLNSDLLCDRDRNGNPVLDADGLPKPIIDIFEGSTYANKNNLPPDFIETLEATYQGQMRERFLMGKWAAYEGLIYFMFDESVHAVSQMHMASYFEALMNSNYKVPIIEAYDHGLAVPSCYGFSFVDPMGNVCLLDGFYEKEMPPDQAAEVVKKIRRRYLGTSDVEDRIYADPSLFRRTPTGQRGVVGRALSEVFSTDYGITLQRGNNDITNGIVKVQGYLYPQRMHKSPFSGDAPAPYFYVSDHLQWFFDEIHEYIWKRNPSGDIEDKPVDRNDHAMDMMKYMMSRRPAIASIIPQVLPQTPKFMNAWTEAEEGSDTRRSGRYG